jgi:hypothetical protein
MPKLDDRISAMEERLKQLKARQQRAEARKRTLDSKKKRQVDTRRKILVGAIVLAQVERGEFSERELRELLDRWLEREDDRALFDLAPKTAVV